MEPLGQLVFARVYAASYGQGAVSVRAEPEFGHQIENRSKVT
jgi:hypothetical protein